MTDKIVWSPEEIKTWKGVKNTLSPFEISTGNIEFNDTQKTFHIINSTNDSIKNLMWWNGRLSGYYAEQYLRMTDRVPTEFRPLMAIIEAYDIPRMKLLEDNICAWWISTALQYAKGNNIINTEDFLIWLKDYFVRLIEMNKNNSAMGYFIDQIQKGINFIDSELA